MVLKMLPKLLVSVRNAQEARIAAEAGVDIIDLKEPKQGSLGMVLPTVLRECVASVRAVNSRCQLSAACGELVEFAPLVPPASLSGFNYFKIGLAGMHGKENWQATWQHMRDQLGPENGESTPRCVAVAYVDSANANAPEIEDVIEAAAASDCAGVLFDTFQKNDMRFSDWVSDSRLKHFLKVIHQHGMFCSIAGKLTLADVSHFSKFSENVPAGRAVDVIAVRSAACIQDQRTSEVSAARIQELQERLRGASASQFLE
ncbi:(5-formylfuran-3-yl)methyl phosphate synthase [Thalassoglobus polymorphus]|uniref:(5-formylfuran-3-yl)methyl phosphate synthase n=1 Tax=Thalassoglobus polymorphus TaxID=2527994 RepID=A0A517QQY7_9PLAN|nr:(5-formylfuran-3-yl)methyl phosphate synthase [Thalassoglobus polymorphus]QDT34041.1 hypothetical protein Mal48_33000 [Thalassoglobus polymorphus]